MFKCCFTGCSFSVVNHLAYVKHLCDFHGSIGNLRCNFKNTCAYVFKTTDKLLNHVKFHSESNIPKTIQDYLVWCFHDVCNNHLASSISKFLKHCLKNHKYREKSCIFKNCDFIPNLNYKVWVNHMRNKHPKYRESYENLKDIHKSNKFRLTLIF